MGAVLLALVRIVLGAVFLYAAATKVPNMAAFADDLANYRIMPASLVPWASAMVVGVEIVAAAVLIVGAFARAAACVISALLVGFIVGLSQALLRGIDLRCGCFGGAELATWGTVGRDVVMLASALAIAWKGPGKILGIRRPKVATGA